MVMVAVKTPEYGEAFVKFVKLPPPLVLTCH